MLGIPTSEVQTNGKVSLADFKNAILAPEDLLPTRPSLESFVPELPEETKHDPRLAATASPWLDAYIKFSRQWSPRSHDDFHESVGLWLLSTIAARRVCLDMGKRRYTSLYIALASRTSVFAKSTTAEIAQAVLKEIGLNFLMTPDDSTPQAFVRSMTYKLPDTWEQLPEEIKQQRMLRYAFVAQRSWFFDEFGQKVSAMMREGGFMADFRGLLRKFDDTPEVYEYETVNRSDVVYAPYLALLANLTPADLKPYAKRGSSLWNDGFWARFAFLTPGPHAERKNGRFPNVEREIPQAVTFPLRRWHDRLGVVPAQIVKREVDFKTFTEILAQPPVAHQCTLGSGVYDAYYEYNDALISIVAQSNLTDLDGNYSRLPEKALRVAMLLASLENNNIIEMRHWHRAQQVAETWRRNLHNLYDQVVGNAEESKSIAIEDRIMKLIAEKGPRTKREMCQGIWGLDSNQVNIIVKGMIDAGFIAPMKDGRAERYRLVVEAESVEEV